MPTMTPPAAEKTPRTVIRITCILGVLFILLTAVAWLLTPERTEAAPAVSSRNSPLQISEYMSSNRAYPDESGEFFDWVELHNATSSPLSLQGYALTDGTNTWLLPGRELSADGYLVVFCDGEGKKENHANLRLKAAGGEQLTLQNGAGQTVETITTMPLQTNTSAVRGDGTFTATSSITPGYPNTEEGRAAFEASRTAPSTGLVISELMAANTVSWPDGDGAYTDYIEVENRSGASVDLTNYGLSNDKNEPLKFRFPAMTLEPGGVALVYASGKGHSADASELHAGFKLSRASDTVFLSTPAGLLLDSVEINGLPEDTALLRQEDGAFVQSAVPSPGFPNTADGTDAYWRALDERRPSPLRISEAISRNTKYGRALAGKYHDWIELHNISSEAVSLAGYTLTNDPSQPGLFALPDKTIPAGGYLVIYATGGIEIANSGAYIQAPFKLDGEGCAVALFSPDGRMADGLSLPNLPQDTSRGRPEGKSGFAFFDTPTPGAANPAGVRNLTPTPAALTAAGVYEGVDKVEVALAGTGALHYTLDGSAPTASSPRYTAPLSFSKTTVLRAVAIGEDALPSPVLTASYIVNEGHTMDVISLSADPDDLFGYRNGIYALGPGKTTWAYEGANFWQRWERAAHAELFAGDTPAFSVDCGVRIFGGMSRGYEKKSFSLRFRDCYGPGELDYKVFDNREFTNYNALVLRASGQDRLRTLFKDAVITSLADSEGLLEVQAYRPVVLYINGEYWGVYNIREKIDEHFIATHQNVSPGSVELLTGNGVSGAEYQELLRYIRSKGTLNDEAYAYVTDRIDPVSFCDYLIAEIYCANNDAGNIRFYRSSEMDGKWRWIFYDTDQGFDSNLADRIWYNINPNGTGAGGNFSTTLVNGLLTHADFRRLFIERLEYNMKNTWSTERVLARIDEFAARYEPEVKRNFERWDPGNRVWEQEVQRMRNFTKGRQAVIKKELSGSRINSLFGLSAEEIDRCFE